MSQPAVWQDDPACGHDVAQAYQTHYCTYIRVPRLLGLSEAATSPDERLLLTAYQWYELWFRVLLADLRAALADDATTYEPVKLLRRGVEIFRLFDLHADLAETVIVRDAGSSKSLRLAQSSLSTDGMASASSQFNELATLAVDLPRLGRHVYPGLAEGVREYAAHCDDFQKRFRKFLGETLVPAEAVQVPTYAEWLCLQQLLALQDGVKAAWTEPGREPTAHWVPETIHPDELMFIVVHQAFEVWFKVILDHIDRSIAALQNDDVSRATRLLRRVALIQRLLVQQIQIPATMLPLDFMRFRSQKMERNGKVFKTGLSPASGTESYQFREIEIVAGLRDDPAFRSFLAEAEKLPVRFLTPRQAERLQQPTLLDAFREAVHRRGLRQYDELFTPSNVPNPHADLAQLADTLIEFDQFFRFWRFGHVSMVEKMIGARSGTGFLGPEYLMETTGLQLQQKNRVFEERQIRPRFFEELWDVRTRLSVY